MDNASGQTTPRTVQDLVNAGFPEATLYSLIRRGHIDARRLDPSVPHSPFSISAREYHRVLESRERYGLVVPPAYHGWRTVEEMSSAIGKNKDSIWRHLQEGYIQGVKVRSRGRGGFWLIAPDAYDAFVQRYQEAHQHLQQWHPVDTYARTMGLSVQWVRDLIRAGRIQADRITRVEAMIVTKDNHVYRIPPAEMELAQRVQQMITIGQLLDSLEIEGIHFSRGYILSTVIPGLGIETEKYTARKARFSAEEVVAIRDYIIAHSRTVRLQRRKRELDLDQRVLQEEPPSLQDSSTLEQEQRLWRLTRDGNAHAFKHITATYLSYIHGTARRYGKGISTQNKVSRGILGLWFAIINAQEVGNKIRAYAKSYIRGRILDFVREERGKDNTRSLEELVGEDRTLGQKLGITDS